MVKIIIGIFILLGSLGNIMRPDFEFMPYMDPESIGYNLSVYVIIGLGIWLLGSGIRSRKKTKKESLSEFVVEFFTKYKDFLKKHVTSKKPPYLAFFIWIYGVNLAFNLAESGVIKGGNWVSILINSAIFAVILGLLGYWIVGSVYHLGVILSGGKKSAKQSRYIFLYKGIPVYLVAIAATIINSIIYGNSYFLAPTIIAIDIFWIILGVAAFIYSIILSYKAVIYIQKTNPLRTAIFFIVIPALIFTLILSRGVMGAIQYQQEGIIPNEQAIELMNEGKYEEAEQLLNNSLDKLIQSSPDNLLIVYENLALLNDYKGDKEKAIEYYEKSLDYTDEETSHYYYLLGQIALLKANYQDTIDSFNVALELNPENGDVHNLLGLLYSGQIESNIEQDLEKALFHNQYTFDVIGDINTLQNLAINLFDLRLYEESLEAFVYLDELSQTNALAKYHLGLLYYLGGQKEEARMNMAKAISLDSSLEGEDSKKVLED